MKILADTGDYLIVECPSCGSDAFIYKNNPYNIFCNSKNSCGKVTPLTKPERRELELDESSEDEKKVSINKDSRLFLSKFIKNTAKAFPFPESIRSLSVETLRKYNITFLENGLKNFLMKYKDNFKEFSTKNSFNRDILIPIYGMDGEIDRILLRKKVPVKNELKEIQFKVNQLTENVNEIWNIQEIYSSEKKYIYLTEGVYDALSGYEVNSNLIPVSLPGVGKWKQFSKIIKEQPDVFEGKVLLLAFDNDNAGKKYVEEFEKFLKTVEIDYEVIDFSPYSYQETENGESVTYEIKDSNNFLEKDKENFKKLLSKYN